MERKKESMAKQLKIVAGAVLFSLFVTSWASAQQIDQNLWGTWKLTRVEITADEVTKQYSLEEFLLDRYMLPKNRFIALGFDKDTVGVYTSINEMEFPPNAKVEGLFTTNNGELTLTIQNFPSCVFAYTVENKLLKISYAYDNKIFDLIYQFEN